MAKALMTSYRSDSTGKPTTDGGFCGRCGTDCWTRTAYVCPGCDSKVPAAVVAVVEHGAMRGAHGQHGALLWAVTPGGDTLFDDTARGITGRIRPEQWESGGARGMAHPDGPYTGQPGPAAVRWGYLRGYAYGYDSRANDLYKLD
jgi:hypothetical protein